MRKIAFAVILAAALPLAACSTELPEGRAKEQAKAQANQANLNISTPIPVLPLSQERLNLVKRATRINVQNMSSCVTLFSQNGVVVGFFPVNGKVSSLKSYLLSGDQVLDDPNGTMDAGSVVVEQADIDGAYGENADGIFFFTADTDAYVEWKGDYFWSDQCLAPSVQPLLIQATGEQ